MSGFDTLNARTAMRRQLRTAATATTLEHIYRLSCYDIALAPAYDSPAMSEVIRTLRQQPHWPDLLATLPAARGTPGSRIPRHSRADTTPAPPAVLAAHVAALMDVAGGDAGYILAIEEGVADRVAPGAPTTAASRARLARPVEYRKDRGQLTINPKSIILPGKDKPAIRIYPECPEHIRAAIVQAVKDAIANAPTVTDDYTF